MRKLFIVLILTAFVPSCAQCASPEDRLQNLILSYDNYSLAEFQQLVLAHPDLVVKMLDSTNWMKRFNSIGQLYYCCVSRKISCDKTMTTYVAQLKKYRESRFTNIDQLEYQGLKSAIVFFGFDALLATEPFDLSENIATLKTCLATMRSLSLLQNEELFQSLSKTADRIQLALSHTQRDGIRRDFQEAIKLIDSWNDKTTDPEIKALLLAYIQNLVAQLEFHYKKEEFNSSN